MKVYADLTEEEKQLLAVWERNTRAWLNTVFGRGFLEAEILEKQYEKYIKDILYSLDTGEVIPNSGGLAGAEHLTSDEWKVFIRLLKDYLVKYRESHTSKIAKPTVRLKF